VLAVQRLLDRLLFIFFCEDHPDRLLNHDLVKGVVETCPYSCRGRSHTKAYDALKQLFHDLDTGVEAGAWAVPRI